MDGFLLVFDLDGIGRKGAGPGGGAVQLLTRTGLGWTRKYPAIVAGVASLGARQAHLDGELCGFLPDGITSSGPIQTASDAIDPAGLKYFIFELLHLDGEDFCFDALRHEIMIAINEAVQLPDDELTAAVGAASRVVALQSIGQTRP